MLYDVEVFDRAGGFFTDTTTNDRRRALRRLAELDGRGLFVRVIDRLGHRHQEERR
jgi:hypothetical protein